MKPNRKRPKGHPETPSRLRRLASQPWLHRSLALLAAVIVVQHLVAHAGYRPLPLSMGWQDVVVGYPAAGVVGFAALLLWGSDPTPR